MRHLFRLYSCIGLSLLFYSIQVSAEIRSAKKLDSSSHQAKMASNGDFSAHSRDHVSDQPMNHGGSDAGGGSDIEAGFKIKVLSILREIQVMLPVQKQQLKFDPLALSARLSIPNGFKPLCATNEIYQKIHQLKKMAYVTDTSTGIVHLNCSDFSLKDWRPLFTSQEMGDNVFFLHEALRILATENEDDYSVSSSYTAAVMADPEYGAKLMSKSMYSLLSGKNPNCYLQIPTYEYRDYIAGRLVNFVVDGTLVDSIEFKINYRAEDIRAGLIQQGKINSLYSDCGGFSTSMHCANHNSELEKFRKRVLERAQQVGCLL